MASCLDPEVISRLEGLRLLPRFAQRSAITGSMMTTQSRGSSLEFVDYKNYVPGDDPRQIDWKVYGRKDRYYLRSYEGETNYTLWVVLDASRSMKFKGPSASLDKWTFSSKAVLGLVYLALQSRDSCGLALFADGLLEVITPKSSWEFLSQCVHRLDTFEAFGEKTDYVKSFWGLAGKISRRSLVVIFSDFMGDEPDAAVSAFEALTLRRHEVVALRVLDSFEEELGADPSGVTRVVPLESGPKHVDLDFAELEFFYKSRWQEEERIFSMRLAQKWIDYKVLRTKDNPGSALASYLSQR